MNYFRKGFSLIEILIVIAVLAVVGAVVLPQFAKIKENQVLKSAVQETLSSLDKARANTLASLNSYTYGIHFQSDRVIIFRGTTYSSGDSNNETVSIVSPAAISDVTLSGVSGTSGDVYFTRLTGAPSKTGTITIATPNYSKVITISAVGLASSN